MSDPCSLSESSSGCGCSCGAAPAAAAAAAAGFFPLRLRDSNALSFSTQPIVYYAELSDVPEYNNIQQKHYEKKNRPNHFVKAFRWYSQERCANKNAVATPDIGFATWLDDKYQQYLKDKSKDASFKYKTCNIESPAVVPDVVLRKSPKPRGLKRVLRSPWRKRHADADVKTLEGGNGCTECKSSWQTLLRPKSLSRFESENCTQKRSISGCASSKVTVTSSDTEVIKSKKRDLVVEEITARSDYVLNGDKNISDIKTTKNVVADTTARRDDVLNSDKNISNNKTTTNVAKDTTAQSYVVLNSDKNIRGNKSAKKKNNLDCNYILFGENTTTFKCECPEEEVITSINYKTDMTTQYDANIKNEKKPLKQVTPIATENAYTATSNEKNDILVQKNTEESKLVIPSTTTRDPVKSTRSISDNHENHKRIFVCGCSELLADNDAQTSDYAIIPGQVSPGHPLFLRIV